MTQPDLSNHTRVMRAKKVNRAVVGCLGFSLAAGVAALWAAVHLMGKWESLNGAVRVATIVLVVIGTIFLIPATFAVVASIPRLFGRKPQSGNPPSSAHRGVEKMKQLLVDRHEFRPATDADFSNRDRSWYEATTRELQALGYRCLGERVSLTMERAIGVLLVVRGFVSADLTTMACIYHFVRPDKTTSAATDARICDFSSELSDGTFIETSNSASVNLVSVPPQIQSNKYPAETSAAELHRLHGEAKDKSLLAGVQFTAIKSIEDVDAAQQRQQAIRAAFRKGIGYVDPAEVRRIAERKFPNNPAQVERMVAHFDAAREQTSDGKPTS